MCKILFGALILALLWTRAGFWQLDRDTIALAPADARSRAFLTATFEVQNRLDGLFIVDPQSI